MVTFNSSYVITNRNNVAYDTATGNDALVPLSPTSTPPGVQGSMWFYTASGSYVCNSTQYGATNPGKPATVVPPSFLAALVKDLQATVGGDGVAHLCVYLHGLGDTFGDSVVDLANLGNFLAAYGGYGGLVLAFDWPSYDAWESVAHYASSAPPPEFTSGTIRDNINGTTAAFVNMMMFLQAVAAQMKLQINVVCHSEGNYMMMLGMQALQQFLQKNPTTWQNIDQVILLAPDINGAALYALNPADTSIGWGVDLASYANQVTIYYSSGDPVLKQSQSQFAQYHDPSQPNRLGLTGPSDGNGTKYGQAHMPSNVVALDCSSVINATVCAVYKQLGYLPDVLGVNAHSLYMYCPQVLTDITQTMNDVPAGDVTNRVPQSRPDGTGFTMSLAAYPPPATTKPCSGASATTSPRDEALVEAFRARPGKHPR